MPVRLAIDYGSGYTKAVLGWPDGRWTLLGFDGGCMLSNAVHVASGATAVGAEAWRLAEKDPDGFVASLLRAGADRVAAGGVDVEGSDLVAATLRQVAAEAARVAGEPVQDVRMVVPAGWGPRRRTWLRRAAGKAGLGQPHLIEAPVAATTSLLRRGTGESAPLVTLVLDVGAGCEVSVLRQDPTVGVEVLSTLADPEAGGDKIDVALIEAVTGRKFDAWPAEQRWPLISNVRVTKQALTVQPAVTMTMPDGTPPIVVNSLLLRQVAQPVLQRVGELAAEAVGNADLSLADVNAVYAIGATMGMPGAVETIAETLGATPHLVEQPAVAAVLGAVGADPSAVSEDAKGRNAVGRVPPVCRIFGLLLPGVLSLVLFGHFVFTAEFNNGTPTRPGPHYYVLASWGELAVAAVLAVLAALQASALFAQVLDGQPSEGRSSRPGPSRISAGIGLAVAAGVAVAGLYAVTAAVFFAQPVAGPLRWAVLPVVPVAGCAVVLAVITWRRPTSASGGDSVLAFPVSAVVLASVGILAVAGWWHGHLPLWLASRAGALGYAGGVLIGAAIACTLVRHLVARIVLSVLLGFFCLIISRSGPGILAVLFAVAAGSWWAHRAWAVARIGQTIHAS